MPETTAKPSTYFHLLPPETISHVRSFLTRASDSICLDQSLVSHVITIPSEDDIERAEQDQKELDMEEISFWSQIPEQEFDFDLVEDDLFYEPDVVDPW